VIPASFEYARAGSVDEAISLLGSTEDAKVIAGGHSLLPLMRLRFARPALLVDIDRLSDLEYVRDGGDHIEIGALARMCDLALDPLLRAESPLVAYTASVVGDPQVRHRATLGGCVAHGDPASDPPTTLLALDASLVVRGPSGERVVAAGDFFKGIFETDLGEQDILTAVRVPKTGSAGWSYQKFHRRAIDWAIVGVAAIVHRDNGNVSSAAVALTNMGAKPLRASGVEAALAGQPATAESAAAAAEHAAEGTDPVSDTNASAEFRQHLARVLTKRALEEAFAK
jgi:aerobic carbon-monoxide dehydrogenase medium subunit